MTHKEKYISSIEDTYAEGILTVKSKVADYAKDSDAFSNFRFAAQAANCTVEQVLLMLLGIKLARLTNLLTSGRDPNNESTFDTMVDAINYNAILKAYTEFKNSADADYAYSDSSQPSDTEVPPMDLKDYVNMPYDELVETLDKTNPDSPEETPEPSALNRLGTFLFGKPN